MLKGLLFTGEFLSEGVSEYEEWKSLPGETLIEFRENIQETFAKFPTQGNPNEATTENDLIQPVIEALGWKDYLTQQTTSLKGRKDVPDFVLFPNEQAKQRANKEKKDAGRYKFGLSFLEAKAWQTPLDRKSEKQSEKQNVDKIPSNQMLRYLSRVETQSDRKIKWGVLTNGRHWRLYYQGAKSRSEDFLELDLPVILKLKGFDPELFDQEELQKQDWLKVFFLLFRREAFLPIAREEKTFHEHALERGRFWESQVAQDLSDVVFQKVFPQLVLGLKTNDPDAPAKPDSSYLEELRNAALTFLYRLLFVLFAEDRNLLPVKDDKYDDYGLRKRVREDIARRLDQEDTFSTTQDDYYHKTCNLFRAIDSGDPSIGLPPYNGGLFDQQRNKLLNRAKLPDSTFAPLLDKLSRRGKNPGGKWINYRDLSVQQLGSIYERLLEFELAFDADGNLAVRPNIFARKTSGSYYTPEPLVKLILEKTVGPLLNEKMEAFVNQSRKLKSRSTPKSKRLQELAGLDPASAMLDIRICDPAMGSGHFLVSLVDYLADRILEAVVEAQEMVDWADENTPYTSPLQEKILSIRDQIKEQATSNSWKIEEDQLDDRHIVRRMILKRCVYGVDKNPMAVELAKVALWLHTFTVGAPLSFLDHHLRCGDSLFGEFVYGVEGYLQERGRMFIGSELSQAKQTAKVMAMIEGVTDADISEVRESADKFSVIDKATRPLNKFFSFLHAIHWLDQDGENKLAVQGILDQTYGDPVKLVAEKIPVPKNAPKRVNQVLEKTRELENEERFLHWEIAFPGVWDHWERHEPAGGFDAVIGNPPWDKMRLEDVPWFVTRKPEIAYATRKSQRKTMIQQLKDQNDPLWEDYLRAGNRAKAATALARKGGQYPLLSKGDINLYSLFVERAHRLVKSTGMVGLLTPSGIASDKGASEFFKSIAGRLAGLYDFENKKIFFPEVDSRFKFCALIAGGKKRSFDETEMAFFLHDTGTLENPERCFSLNAKDFGRINPNTGTAPVFRTRRDAEITKRIYERFPILSHHKKDKVLKVWKVWPVKYHTMFHMANDSHLFRTKEELEKEGFYPVEGSRLKKGKEEYAPLYEGKMVQAYDHRAASVWVNIDNLNRPGQPLSATIEQHKNPKWFPVPQYWINGNNILIDENLQWYFSFKDITASTNARTMIASLIPRHGANHKLPLLLPKESASSGIRVYKKLSPLLLANLDSFVFDYTLRQKLQSTSLTWFVLEQLPVIPPEKFEEKIGQIKIADFVRDEVLRLTYTAWDMKPFAKDMGYSGDPFIWDEEDRRHRKAKLDALFFLLYEMDDEDAGYVLDTFPIVKRNDEAAFDGLYYTKELILVYMRALRVGDTEARIVL